MSSEFDYDLVWGPDEDDRNTEFINPSSCSSGSNDNDSSTSSANPSSCLSGSNYNDPSTSSSANNDHNFGIFEDEDEEETQNDSVDIEHLSQIKNCVHKDWLKEDLNFSDMPNETNFSFPKDNFEDLESMTPTSIFELFFDTNAFDYLRKHINIYAKQQNRIVPKFTIEELKACFGILIISGYSPVRDRGLYWSNEESTNNILISQCMRRDRFDQFINNCHWVDNSRFKIGNNDSYHKVRPLIEMLQDRFNKYYFPETFDLSYDESMIKYFGRHPCKQFIPRKPIRSGFKAFCLCAPSGYCLNFSLYQGSDPFIDTRFIKVFGKLLSPIIIFLEQLKYKDIPYRFFQDNAFTSQLWLYYCRSKGYSATGTMRKNRLPNGLKLDQKLNKRGDYVYFSSKNANMVVCKWQDNREVIVASNCFGVYNEKKETENSIRWCKEKKKRIKVSQPFLISKYNRSMGGTDRMNQNVNMYRIGIRSKKFYFVIFTWLLDVTIQNAWIIYRKHSHEPKITMYEFKRRLANYYCKQFISAPKTLGSVAHHPNGTSIPNELRLDRIDHWPAKYGVRGQNSIQIRNRCKLPKCNKLSAFYCEKCKTTLCITCFKTFHSF